MTETNPSGSEPKPSQVVEALLFAAGEPLSVERLRSLTGIEDGREIRALVEGLRMDYAEQGRAFVIEEVGGGFRMLTRTEFAPWLMKLRRREEEARLSPAALETLSIIAYRQPVLRADIEAIRGVSCGEVLRGLMERGLAKIAGRADTLGRPILYGTSKKFLEVFGLEDLKDLPKPEEVA